MKLKKPKKQEQLPTRESLKMLDDLPFGDGTRLTEQEKLENSILLAKFRAKKRKKTA